MKIDKMQVRALLVQKRDEAEAQLLQATDNEAARLRESLTEVLTDLREDVARLSKLAKMSDKKLLKQFEDGSYVHVRGGRYIQRGRNEREILRRQIEYFNRGIKLLDLCATPTITVREAEKMLGGLLDMVL